jgi:bifunctional DNA-binding transcriptional regulator/antitoxin component of YhaV-PrlF toxin-antitoxin module
MAINMVQMRKKGGFTLPVRLREKYGLDEGDVFTVIDMGDGSFLFTPRISKVNYLADRVTEIVEMEELELDELLLTLNEEREQYYRDHYE